MKKKRSVRSKGGSRPDGPRCRFCGRRNTVRRLEDRRFYCDHCQKMFQVE